jgi:N-acetylmuramoyl-L-alanine amidase
MERPAITRRPQGRLFLAALLGAALVLGTGAAKPNGPGAQPLVIQEISWREFGLVVKASGPIEPDFFTLPRPDRFVIDLPAAELADANLAQTIQVGKGAIKQVRLAEKSNHAVRMVIDCTSAVNFQLLQAGDRSTLIIAPPGANTARLAAMIKGGDGYQGGGQELQSIWARETKDGATLALRAAKPLTYALFEEDPSRLQVRIPQGRYRGVPPLTGKHLIKTTLKPTEGGTLTLHMGLAEGHYQLSETLSADRTRLTLSWKKLEPRRFANRPLIVIDPGHGGADPGALGPGKVTEKQVNRGLALALQKALVAKRYNAILTRSVDSEVYLAPRLGLIDRHKADMFVSLHANSHVTPDSSGVETYWREAHSQPLAQAVQKQVTTLLSRPDRGVKQERLYVIRHPRVPSILLETGFISNPFEEILLADGEFQTQAARAIVGGIEAYMAAPATTAKGERSSKVQKEGRAGTTPRS